MKEEGGGETGAWGKKEKGPGGKKGKRENGKGRQGKKGKGRNHQWSKMSETSLFRLKRIPEKGGLKALHKRQVGRALMRKTCGSTGQRGNAPGAKGGSSGTLPLLTRCLRNQEGVGKTQKREKRGTMQKDWRKGGKNRQARRT